MLSTNRVVILLTPLFTAVAGVASAYLTKHGIQGVSASDIKAAEILGATSAITGASMWIRGHHKEMDIAAAVEKDALAVARAITDAAEEASPPPAQATPGSLATPTSQVEGGASA